MSKTEKMKKMLDDLKKDLELFYHCFVEHDTDSTDERHEELQNKISLIEKELEKGD